MTTRTQLAALVLACASLVSAVALADGGALDGKTFSGKLVQMGKKKGEKDKLVFKDGKLTSTGCVQYGFKEGSYSAKTEGDKTTFEADIAGEGSSKMHWTGTITGDKLEATAVRTEEGEKEMTSHFAGNLAMGAKKAKKQ